MAFGKGRVEAFSDGVIAIIITIMVLDLRPPPAAEWAALAPLLPEALCYTLSFVFLGIYWNNHHHLFQAVRQVNGAILWANLHLLFWLSLIPFVTSWMARTRFAPRPLALYGVVLIGAALAYTLLTGALLRHHGRDSTLARALGRDLKGKLSLALYALAIPLAFVHAALCGALYVAVAIVWLIPDRRIERALGHEAEAR